MAAVRDISRSDEAFYDCPIIATLGNSVRHVCHRVRADMAGRRTRVHALQTGPPDRNAADGRTDTRTHTHTHTDD